MFFNFILERRRVADILRQFYTTDLSISSLQPVRDLAVELNPDLKGSAPNRTQSLPRPDQPHLVPVNAPALPSVAPSCAADAHLGAVEV